MTCCQRPASLFNNRLVAGVVKSTSVGVKHDPGAEPALTRKPLLQDVHCMLGLNARDTEAVIELSTERALQRYDGSGDHEPDANHPERVSGTVTAEAKQKCTHALTS